jgi:type VI secretion system secreted protein VgrG
VSKFSYAGTDDRLHKYTAEVVPWLWFLTMTADCRIFQEKTVPDIIEQIFNDLGFSDFETQGIKGAHPVWEYCVQYRETDFDFVSRLMEQEGIFYYFRQEQGKHTLVLADQVNTYEDCPENEVTCGSSGRSVESDDMITSWAHEYVYRPGKWAQTDYNFESPGDSLMTNTNTIVELDKIDKYEVYDYPGEYAYKEDGNTIVKLRMEEEEVSHDVVVASSLCRTFRPGGKFTLTAHRNDAEAGKSYVLLAVDHFASVSGVYATSSGSTVEYSNHFTCIPSSTVFRPARTTPKPIVQGSQTAVVVGPAGEEIHTDKYGRVKVQFFWDREGQKDDKSSCWMRVAQLWAGQNWGSIHIPRIGQEVMVDFLEGDPDRPIVTGRVYNNDQMPPYELPANKTVSGIKSRSTKGGGPSNFNEIRFEDKKGGEELYIHAEKDKTIMVENDETATVGHDLTLLVQNNKSETVGVDESISIGNNRTETVGANESLTVGASRTRNVGQNEQVTVGVNRTHTVGVNEAITVGASQEITVGAARTVTVGATQSTSIGASLSESIAASKSVSVGGDQTVSVGGSDSLTVGGNLTVEAGDSITLKTGGAEIIMKKDGTITIKGKDINVEGSGKINMKAGSDVTIKGSKILQN